MRDSKTDVCLIHRHVRGRHLFYEADYVICHTLRYVRTHTHLNKHTQIAHEACTFDEKLVYLRALNAHTFSKACTIT